MRGKLHGIDAEFDIHIALHLPAALAVDIFLGGLCHHRKPVVVQPVHQGTDRRIVVVFQKRGIVEGPQQFAPAHELLTQELVVDVKPKCLGGRIQVRAIYKER